jgi:Fe-S oxidoreductase
MTALIPTGKGADHFRGLKVGLLFPAIDLIYPEVGIAILELLERFGLDVNFPLNQTCCGQPMSNSPGSGTNPE